MIIDYLQYIVFIGATIQLAGIFAYIRETLKGKTKPNRVTWLIWSIAPLIATFAAIADGVTWAVIPVFMSGFGPFLVFLASFVNKKSYWKLTSLDYLCGIFSLLALVLWLITCHPIIAIVFAILSDFLAAIPTLIKTWKNPRSETIDFYIASFLSGITCFFAVTTWSFSSYAFPIYLVLNNALFVILILSSKTLKRRKVI
jgi:hypothetical protein